MGALVNLISASGVILQQNTPPLLLIMDEELAGHVLRIAQIFAAIISVMENVLSPMVGFLALNHMVITSGVLVEFDHEVKLESESSQKNRKLKHLVYPKL